MSENNAICTFPFNAAQISMQGEVFVCCPPWCNNYSFGNIYEQSFDEIWNGDKAKEFRRQFINNNYKYCNLDLCVKDCSQNIQPSEIAPKPKTFIFCYDSTCNVKCIFCRSCHQKQDLSYFDENMDEIISNMLENAENVVLSGVGEALFSPHSRKLIKRISEMFPNIKFSLISNGILCDEENLKQLGIIDKLLSITISLHAVKKSTYDKLVKNGDFDKVMKNLKFLSELKQNGKLDRFILNFVVTSYNYKEMPDYINMAEKFGATVGFLELLKLDTNENVYKELNIFNENHPKYNDFVRVMKNPIFRSGKCTINDSMLKINVNKRGKNLMKLLKILAVNILLLSLIVFIFNFIIFYMGIKQDPNSSMCNITRIFDDYKGFMLRDISNNETYSVLIKNKYNWYRKTENINSEKPSVILFGCSFIWGTGLNDEETFSYQLGKLTGRPIFNRALGGWGVQHMLYQLKQKEFYSQFKNPPEYIIYTFFPGHYIRMKTPVNEVYIPCYLVFYKYKNKKFILRKNTFLNSKIIILHFLRNKFQNVFETRKRYKKKVDFELFNYLLESKKEMEKHWPNTKFVVFLYEQPYNDYIEKKLQLNNFIIISNKNFQINPDEQKYRLLDAHPSALYWKDVTPKIVEVLKL